jgi:hypothetical protein
MEILEMKSVPRGTPTTPTWEGEEHSAAGQGRRLRCGLKEEVGVGDGASGGVEAEASDGIEGGGGDDAASREAAVAPKEVVVMVRRRWRDVEGGSGDGAASREAAPPPREAVV